LHGILIQHVLHYVKQIHHLLHEYLGRSNCCDLASIKLVVKADHLLVTECAVVAGKDQDDLVRPWAFVVTNGEVVGTEDLSDNLRQFLKGRAKTYMIPKWFEFRNTLPRTANGKLQRYMLPDSNK
jgi:acyl-CoA synthetase (AMP-forming)/AMP-acid ligase II